MTNQVSIDIIRVAYANMGDVELLDFAKNEGVKLSVDAFLVLRQECNKRGIGAETIRAMEHEIILQESLKSRRLSEDLNNSLFQEALDFSLTKKKQGASDYDIYAGLIEMGVNDEYSNHIVNKLPEWTDRLHKDSTTEIQTSIGIILLGILATYVAISIGQFQLGAIIIIIVGLVKVILWSLKKGNYKKIIEQFESEQRTTAE